MKRASAICIGLLASINVVGTALASDADTRLGAAMETAFRACALQVSRGGSYFAAGNASELASVGITLGETPPGEYRGMFAEAQYGTPVFAKLASPDATIWLAGFTASPVCKVVVGDTPDALGGRTEIGKRFSATTSWTVEAPEAQGGLLSQSFTLNAARPGPHMTMLITGPSAVMNGGRGPQALMTIAFTNSGK